MPNTDFDNLSHNATTIVEARTNKQPINEISSLSDNPTNKNTPINAIIPNNQIVKEAFSLKKSSFDYVFPDRKCIISTASTETHTFYYNKKQPGGFTPSAVSQSLF